MSTDKIEDIMKFSSENTKLFKKFIYRGPETIVVAPHFFTRNVTTIMTFHRLKKTFERNVIKIHIYP